MSQFNFNVNMNFGETLIPPATHRPSFVRLCPYFLERVLGTFHCVVGISGKPQTYEDIPGDVRENLVLAVTHEAKQTFHVEVIISRDSIFDRTAELWITDPKGNKINLLTGTFPFKSIESLSVEMETPIGSSSVKETVVPTIEAPKLAPAKVEDIKEVLNSRDVLVDNDPVIIELRTKIKEMIAESGATINDIASAMDWSVNAVTCMAAGGGLGSLATEEGLKKTIDSLAELFSKRVQTKVGVAAAEILTPENKPSVKKEVPEAKDPVVEAKKVQVALIQRSVDLFDTETKIHDAARASGIDFYLLGKCYVGQVCEIELSVLEGIAKRLVKPVKKVVQRTIGDIDERNALAAKLKAEIEKLPKIPQRGLGTIVGLPQTTVSKILRGAIATNASVAGLTVYLNKVTKNVQEYLATEAKSTLKAAKRSEEKRIQADIDDEIAKEDEKPIEKIHDELYAMMLASNIQIAELADATDVPQATILNVSNRTFAGIGRDRALAMMERLKAYMEKKAQAPAPKTVKSLQDLGQLSVEKKGPLHASGVEFTKQFTKEVYTEADNYLLNVFGKPGSYKTSRVVDRFFNKNKQELNIISKNSMELHKLTGIPFNILVKSFNYDSKITPRDMVAIHLYLESIKDTIEAIVSAKA